MGKTEKIIALFCIGLVFTIGVYVGVKIEEIWSKRYKDLLMYCVVNYYK